MADLKIKSYCFTLRSPLWLNQKLLLLLLLLNQAMQGKIKNFRHFIYRRNSYKAIIPDRQVKISHTHTHTVIHYKDSLFGFTKRNPKMLKITANKQNPMLSHLLFYNSVLGPLFRFNSSLFR